MSQWQSSRFLLLGVCCCLLFFPAARGTACSTFCLREGSHILLGKNFDWYTGEGFLSINARKVMKTAFVLPPERPIRWTATYGSVTFNQIGREFPFGGMNEAGLVVELLWLSDTRYPPPDARPALNELQWIQYQLDTAGSVSDVLQSDTAVRITQPHSAVHYFVCDRAGNAATIEFLDGRLVTHTGAALPVPVLTNSSYARSLAYLRTQQERGSRQGIPLSSSSLDRFVRAGSRVQTGAASDSSSLVESAFAILDAVAQGAVTQWRIVYDVEQLQISFTTSAQPHVRRIALPELEFTCASPRTMLDLKGELAGRFTPYTTEQGHVLLQRVVSQLAAVGFFQQTPTANEIEQFARYPDTVVCGP